MTSSGRGRDGSGSITDSMDMNLSKLWKIMEDRRGWRAADYRLKESDTTEQLNDNLR